MRRRSLLPVLAWLAFLCPAWPAAAQSGDASGADASQAAEAVDADRLSRESQAAFNRRDYKAAEASLRRLVEVEPENFVPWYNLACALSLQDRTEEAGPMLEKAIELGFSDLRHMQADPHLASLRKTENFRRIVENWDDILGAHVEQRLEAARKRYGPRYTYERNDARRLAYVSAFPEDSFKQAKEQIERSIAWWETYVCAPGASTETDTRPWVLVILPNQKDYASWARGRYGESWERVGGVYSHDNKSLIAKDIGSTLRHEFWHVLHWRHMDALGQRHPAWVMEGLCSLMEDVEVGAGGRARPLPSYRTNQAGRLARVGKLTPWEVLFKLDQGRFVGSRPLSFYGQSRSIFMWLFETGKLKDWYAAYTAGYGEDPSGLSAFERTFGKPVKKVEADYKMWIRSLPEIPEDFEAGSAVLPFDVEMVGSGDGLIVAQSGGLESLSRPGRRTRSTGGILPRDVILAIDDRPVRDVYELIRILQDYAPGTEVSITYRRVRNQSTAKVTLIEKR